MKIEKIKSVPKYIVERIKRYDKENLTCAPGHTRFYSYLTKNDGELVKVTVAVRNHYKQWLYKQVAVHGLNSKECFVKDMVFLYRRLSGRLVRARLAKIRALVRKHRLGLFRR